MTTAKSAATWEKRVARWGRERHGARSPAPTCPLVGVAALGGVAGPLLPRDRRPIRLRGRGLRRAGQLDGDLVRQRRPPRLA